MGVRGSARGPHRRHRPLFEPVRSGRAALGTLLNAKTGQKALYGLPMGQYRAIHPRLEEPPGAGGVHARRHSEGVGRLLVLLVRSGAAGGAQGTGPRRHLGRRAFDVGATRSTRRTSSDQFMAAYDADYVTRDGRLVIDDPEIRRGSSRRSTATRPSIARAAPRPIRSTWDASGNNKAFLAQAVVMTPNNSLSILNALKHERPDDYYENTATIEWPLGPTGEAFPIGGGCLRRRGLQGRRPTSPPPRSSSASSWPRAGSRTISTSPASACCRRCRSCSTRRSGSTRATRTTWPR